MTELAIQIGRDGISWAYLPDPFSLDSENVVEGYASVWPRLDDYPGALLPLGTSERLQTYALITEIAEDADFVLLAVEEGTDLRRVGIAEVALQSIGCLVAMRDAHPDGAASIMAAIHHGCTRRGDCGEFAEASGRVRFVQCAVQVRPTCAVVRPPCQEVTVAYPAASSIVLDRSRLRSMPPGQGRGHRSLEIAENLAGQGGPLRCRGGRLQAFRGPHLQTTDAGQPGQPLVLVVDGMGAGNLTYHMAAFRV